MQQVHPTVYTNIWSTDRFIFSESKDWFHNITTSVTGWHGWVAEPAPVEWIGANFRRSLMTAEFKRLPVDTPEHEDRKALDAAASRSDARWTEIIKMITKEFGYRNAQATTAKALMVSGWWQRDIPEGIFLYATNRKQGRCYEALANAGKKHADKMVQLSMDASDESLGTAIRQMLTVSTISGKKVQRDV